jgi:hypothetical protein
MAIGMDDADYVEDEDEAIQAPEPVPGKARFAIEGTPAEPSALEILASLLLGGATEGSDQLGRRLKRWQTTIASHGSQVYSESPYESQQERLRYAVIGLLSQAPDLAQGALSTAVDAAASAYDHFSKWLSPVTRSRPMQPVLRRYNHLAAHGATIVDRWIDAGRAAEQRSRALARQAAFDGEDEAIEEVIGKLAQEPALRELVTQQSVGMAGELMGAIRNRTSQADTRWERRVRALFRRH